MKGLILAALVGFVLAITLALPFTEDEAMAYNDALGEIRTEIIRRYGALMLTLAGMEMRKKHQKRKKWLKFKSIPHLFHYLKILKKP